MVTTDKFKRLALAPGRHLSCRITIGDKAYYDDKILKFDFDDIAHDDYFTIGTTCPNEFSFSVTDYTVTDLYTEVRPYIRFEDSEWYPLGVFYIARRYFRGKYATFVCYDKMYELNDLFKLDIPVGVTSITASKLLETACRQAGLTFKGECAPISVPVTSSAMTLRTVIGYVAMLNCACAKIDKDGILVFKKYTGMPTETLSCDNCFNITRNIIRAGISSLKVNTGDSVFQYGNHTELSTGLSTVDLYNPFMTQDLVDDIGQRLSSLYFYGAEVQMQGLPFLEAGDFIMLEEDDGAISPIVMSEIKYHYNGSLTAKLFSKNKTYDDTVVHRKEFENALAELWAYVRNS